MDYINENYKDHKLGTQINKALQEYNSLAYKLSGTNNQYNHYLYNNPYANKYNLTRNNRFSSLKRNDYSYPNTFRGNLNIKSLNNKNYGNQDLIEEFKETLEKSQIIKDDLLRMGSKFGFSKKYKNKKFEYLNKNKNNYSYKFLPFNKYEESLFEEEKSSTSNGGNIEYIPKKENRLEVSNGKKSSKKKKNKNSAKNGKDEKKLENEGKNIINKYQDIKKENRILELEINNYKKLINQHLSFGNNYKNKGNNKYSQKTINELEQSLQQNIQNNCSIIDTILKIKKINDVLSSKIKSLSESMNLNFQKLEQINRENAKIQITNEENEQKIANLQEENHSLLNELESQKISLLKLKNKEKNLNLLNDSNKKALNDKEEHILKLKNTINKYHKQKNDMIRGRSFNITSKENLKLYDEKINSLRIEINNLNSKKQKILLSNTNLQNQIFSFGENNLGDDKEKILKNQFNGLKMENNQKKASLKNKEMQLEMLKHEVDSLTFNFKNNIQLNELQKNEIKNLINDIDSQDNININEQDINEQIKINSELNFQKIKEIEQLYKNFNKANMEKDQLINNLELQINQMYINQPNVINNDLLQKNGIGNPINELKLNDQVINNNLNQGILNFNNPNINNDVDKENDINQLENDDNINEDEYLQLIQDNNLQGQNNFENEDEQCIINDIKNDIDNIQDEDGQFGLEENINENLEQEDQNNEKN